MTDDAFLDEACRYACERLSDKRYEHTLRVADTAERLAVIHGLDPRRARLAALLHDAAREVGKEALLSLARQEGVPVGEPEREKPMLLHGPVAAALARRELGVEDEEVLGAVRAHTTGEPGMGPLALALFVADKIEPERDQPGIEELRDLASKDLRRAAASALERSISYNEERGQETHPESRAALEDLKKGDRPVEATPQDGV